MKNKGTIIIGCLSQIVLLILLIQLTGLVKLFAIGAMFISVGLILISLATDKHWKFDNWITFYINIVLLMAILIYSSQYSLMNPLVVILLIVLLMVNFFIISFTNIQPVKETPVKNKKKEEKDEPILKIVDLEEGVIKRKKETQQGLKTVSIKKPSKNRKTKKKTVKQFVMLKGSSNYHTEDCGYVKKARKNRKKFFSTEKQAKTKKLKACKMCIKE